ncbi:MAG: hypothetical protein LWX11_07435 [Firmicutes bacterium]|nr:hypothetical protein [Bacillota bacterium]
MTHLPFSHSILPQRPWLMALPMVLVGLGVGCYRATGIQRTDVVAQEIPAVGGDRPKGLKADAAPGDFYLGNDSLELAVDGTRFGQGKAVAGAVSGGSIIDVSRVELNQSYQRVSTPMDMLERLTPVLNQDPSINLVFDRFDTENPVGGLSRIVLVGRVHDPLHHLAGASWDAQGIVQGLSVVHSIALGKMDRYFTLTTTVSNTSGAAVAVKNIGDLIYQRTSGFRFNVPAREDMSGAAVNNWGVEIPATGPGTVFGDPAQAVKASMVAFMGVEPSGTIEDAHLSLGLMSVDADTMAVTSEPQRALTTIRPQGPRQMIAGSLPVANVAAGAELTYTRRLYVVGGSSVATDGYSMTPRLSNQATTVFNAMEADRLTLQTKDSGVFVFSPQGTAVRQGPWPTEFRIEQKVDATTWKTYRVEWMEPYDAVTSSYNPAVAFVNAPNVAVVLPAGTYRLKMRNGQSSANASLKDAFFNSASADNPDVLTSLVLASKNLFASNSIRDYLCAERDSVLGAAGQAMGTVATPHTFVSRRADGTILSAQPARISLYGTQGTVDPSSKRIRSIGALFLPTYGAPVAGGGGALPLNFGAFGFQAGNQLFAASMPVRSEFAYWFPKGTYEALASRGPLMPLQTQAITAFDGQSVTQHIFTFPDAALPTGWTTLDLPGPSLATTGGLLPMEKLASALAEGVEIVALTEMDRHADGVTLTKEFRNELAVTILDTDRPALGSAPFGIAARSSELTAFGTASALFVPAPTLERAGGARDSQGWTLADFLSQAQGQFTVVHRPRGAQGLFTLQHFDRATALGQGANAWWNATAPLSNGMTHGSFDALELLRGDFSDAQGQPLDLSVGANADAWFGEFKAVRADWFALLNQQMPTAFTKALGLSSAKFSLDTPAGLARTYVKATGFTQDDMSAVRTALKAGAAVASTGPLLDVTVTPAGSTTSYGPGSLVPAATGWTLNVSLYASSWVPVDEVRIVVNGVVTVTLPFNATNFTQDATDKRLWVLTNAAAKTLALPAGKDAWVVVEAGVSLGQTGAYQAGSPWSRLMKGIYPVAVTNPVFMKAGAPGTAYVPPGL